jgi:hypothetical protein
MSVEWIITDGSKTIPDSEVLDMLNDGVIRVEALDTARPRVIGKSGRPLTPQWHEGNDSPRLCVYIRSGGIKRTIVLNKLVWMADRRLVVPRGFCVHHRDLNYENNAASNLVCMDIRGHQFIHEDRKANF